MIVSCPGCSTHYAHQDEGVLQMGRCARCDETFPLTEVKRCYVVGPALRSVSGRPDPLLESAMQAAAAIVDRPEPAVADAVEEPSLPAPEPPQLQPTPRDQEADDGFFGDGLDDDEALFGIEDEEPAAQPRRERPFAGPSARGAEPPLARRHPFREFVGLVLLSGLGAAAGFQGSLQFGYEPQTAVAAGLAAGLTLGWAWIRWVERRR